MRCNCFQLTSVVGGRFVPGNEFAVTIADAIIETFSRRHRCAVRPAPHHNPS